MTAMNGICRLLSNFIPRLEIVSNKSRCIEAITRGLFWRLQLKETIIKLEKHWQLQHLHFNLQVKDKLFLNFNLYKPITKSRTASCCHVTFLLFNSSAAERCYRLNRFKFSNTFNLKSNYVGNTKRQSFI